MRLPMDGRWRDDERRRDVVGIGGKSGVYTVLDAKSGEFIWNTLLGPGGDQGGMEWGTAFDGDRIYASITNHHHTPYKLTENGVVGNATVTGGSWAALDPTTGAILWQFAAGSSVNGGSVYWGSGYSRSGAEGSGNHRLYAFSIDGQ
jgi:polyvinyl alcohol dehydrogenase (cytochrome)